MEDVWLQHDEAHPPFAFSIRDVLKEHFAIRWTARGSPPALVPLTWPPCSPDRTIPDNSWWVVSRG